MFHDAFIYMLQNEGGYSNDSRDKGGKTKWGISQRAHPSVDIENLTATEAEMIYLKEYWNPLYIKIEERLSTRLFDVGVNIGVKKAIRILQNALNLYFDADLKTDGQFGSNTLKSIKENDQKSIYSMFVFEVSNYYAGLNNETYLKGWLNRLYRNV